MPITAGIDVGAENIKVVVLNNGSAASSIFPLGIESIKKTLEKGLELTAEMAGVAKGEINFIVSTGCGYRDVFFANEKVSGAFCIARAISKITLSASTVVDIGAEKTLVVKCREGRVLNIARNDVCAAGSGRWVEMACKLLDLPANKAGELSLKSNTNIHVESICAVFAETEIISLIHMKNKPEDIMKGVFRGLATRIYPLIIKAGLENNILMVGGLAKNVGIVKAMEAIIGNNIWVPDDPITIGAMGAAIIATERVSKV